MVITPSYNRDIFQTGLTLFKQLGQNFEHAPKYRVSKLHRKGKWKITDNFSRPIVVNHDHKSGKMETKPVDNHRNKNME